LFELAGTVARVIPLTYRLTTTANVCYRSANTEDSAELHFGNLRVSRLVCRVMYFVMAALYLYVLLVADAPKTYRRVWSFLLYLDDFKPPTFLPYTWGQYVEFSQTCTGKDIDILSQGWGFALLVRSLAGNSSHCQGIVTWKEPDPSREAFVTWHWAFLFWYPRDLRA